MVHVKLARPRIDQRPVDNLPCLDWRILLFDPGKVCRVYETALLERGLTVTVRSDVFALVEAANHCRIDLLIVGAPSHDAVADVRVAVEAFGARTIPTLALGVPTAEAAFSDGPPIDRWVPINADVAEFVAVVLSVVRRTRYLLEVSVDTGLPGTTWLSSQVQVCIDIGQDFALAYFDIDRFKSVVDVYGFGRAGDFLRAMARALHEGAAEAGLPRVDIAHIGGDDFLALCESSQVLASEMKRVAKAQPGSYVAVDRQGADGVPVSIESAA